MFKPINDYENIVKGLERSLKFEPFSIAVVIRLVAGRLVAGFLSDFLIKDIKLASLEQLSIDRPQHKVFDREAVLGVTGRCNGQGYTQAREVAKVQLYYQSTRLC